MQHIYARQTHMATLTQYVYTERKKVLNKWKRLVRDTENSPGISY